MPTAQKKIELFDLQRRVLLNSERYFCPCPRWKNAAFLPEVMIWWTGRWICNLLLGSTGSEYAVRVVYCIILSKIWLIANTETLGSAFYCTVCRQSDTLNFETWQIVGGGGQLALASPNSRFWGGLILPVPPWFMPCSVAGWTSDQKVLALHLNWPFHYHVVDLAVMVIHMPLPISSLAVYCVSYMDYCNTILTGASKLSLASFGK